jgi:hypothetical protein
MIIYPYTFNKERMSSISQSRSVTIAAIAGVIPNSELYGIGLPKRGAVTTYPILSLG